jgi:hypothetical protein
MASTANGAIKPRPEGARKSFLNRFLVLTPIEGPEGTTALPIITILTPRILAVVPVRGLAHRMGVAVVKPMRRFKAVPLAWR